MLSTLISLHSESSVNKDVDDKLIRPRFYPWWPYIYPNLKVVKYFRLSCTHKVGTDADGDSKRKLK